MLIKERFLKAVAVLMDTYVAYKVNKDMFG
jgi:hypothetical protein